MIAGRNIVNFLSKSAYGIGGLFTAKLDPQSEAMRHRLRTEVAAVQRLTKAAIDQRTALMDDIMRPRGGRP